MTRTNREVYLTFIVCLVTFIGLLQCRLFDQQKLACSASFVFVPGIVSIANSWEATMPSGVCIVPVDYYPSAAEQRGAGEPGDFTEVAAYRMLTTILKVSLAAAASGKPWAFGGHSAGGAVVYRCMDHLASLITEPLAFARAISSEGIRWLPAEEGLELLELFTRLAGRPPSMPIAAFSFEGSLMPCDVEGWAQEWAEATESPDGLKEDLDQPGSQWTWPMVKACAGSLIANCDSSPPRQLASIQRWLELPQGPRFIYMAGAKSSKRNNIIFPALKSVLQSSGAPDDRLQIKVIPNAGHGMEWDAPDGVRKIIAAAFDS
ncbi:unnamed protein product [Polarella glacialis]|uniref:AB hydrolase-1 domain-containing protein n=1 Tax=Polarella glacialis TaxID=89957 RepID=A0A813H930_POLGL|nr:unnamed protein product [Polarella glacialis]